MGRGCHGRKTHDLLVVVKSDMIVILVMESAQTHERNLPHGVVAAINGPRLARLTLAISVREERKSPDRQVSRLDSRFSTSSVLMTPTRTSASSITNR